MSGEPKVSREDYEKQTAALYEKIGRIVVTIEELNTSIQMATITLLQYKGLEQGYAQILLAGSNIENSRRCWTAIMKNHYCADEFALSAIDHISNRIDGINTRRNNVVHTRWYIGYGNELTESFETASGIQIRRDYKNGGVKFTEHRSNDFTTIHNEISNLDKIMMRWGACVAISFNTPGKGSIGANFHYHLGQLYGNDESH